MTPLPIAGRHPAASARSESAPAALRALARTCEAAGFGQQSGCVTEAGKLLVTHARRLFAEPWDDMFSRALAHAMGGANESAALALMPSTATFTGGRLADGAVIAQVVLGATAAAHSREARWLAMAWLAALLRAVASQIEANSGANLGTEPDQ